MIVTSNIKEIHQEAMQIAQQAYIAKISGDKDIAILLYEKAYFKEREAAFMLLDKEDKEPTRSILFRSAASMAKNCEKYREAEKMIGYGLSGNPPAEVAEELRNLYEEINFHRHLELKYIELDSSEMQLSLVGNETGFGKIRGDEFLSRYQIIEQLTYRTAERKAKKEYRKKGKPIKDIEIFIEEPKGASFAIKIKIGKIEDPSQLNIFKNKIYEEIIDEVLYGIDLINNNQHTKLKADIGNEDYFQNFMTLTKALSPDGNRIKQVGFTVLRDGKTKSIALTKTKDEILPIISAIKPSTENILIEEEIIDIIGVLNTPDREKNKINIIPNDISVGKPISFEVPSRLDDIVTIFWMDTVKVKIKRIGKRFELIDIDRI